MSTFSNDGISAEQFVDQLLKQGAETSCDKSNDSFLKCDSLPDYYDKKLFKKGQEFYQKYIFSIHLMHEVGVLALYAIPSLLSVVLSYGDSVVEVFESYKMQLNINVHIRYLHEMDFDSDEQWKNIGRIKNKHNSVSNGSKRKGSNPINQKDMVLSQIIILGFSMTRGNLVGFHGVTREDWLGYHHFWRVVGYLLGIEERFNICSVPLDKTRKITELMIEKHFKAEMDKKDPKYLEVARIAGLSWSAMLPEFAPKCALNHCYNVLKKKDIGNNIPEPTYEDMSFFLKFYYKIFCFDKMYLMKSDSYRVLRNYLFKFHMYLITTFSDLPKMWLRVITWFDF